MKAVRFPKSVQPLLVPIDRIHQHPNNPNNGDLDIIIESIQKSGFVSVITADAHTGEIIAGNHRYQALLALGAKEAPVLWVDHWSKDDALTYLVGDNETGRRAVMNKRELADILVYLRDTQNGLVGTGHDEETLLKLMEEVLAQEGQIPETPGFGEFAPSGIFQIVIDFEDSEARDTAYAALEFTDPQWAIRKVNL